MYLKFPLYIVDSQQLVHIPPTRNFEEPEHIFVTHSGTLWNTGQENPLK